MSGKNIILVVEDNDFIRLQIAGFLKSAGHDVAEARDGEEALVLMEQNDDIALAVVDVRMEPMGGFEFIRNLPERDITTPIVLVTGDQTADLLEQANRLGVGAVLMKPVEKDRLIKTVERILKTKRRAV